MSGTEATDHLLTRMRRRYIATAVAVVLVATAGATIVLSQADADPVAAWRPATTVCTTSSNGYCLVPHDLGVPPTAVNITMVTPSLALYSWDRPTNTTWRLRVRQPYSNQPFVGTVTFSWAAYRTPDVATTVPAPTETPTTPAPTTTAPTATTVPPTTVPPTTPAPTTTAPSTGNPWVDPATTGVKLATLDTYGGRRVCDAADIAAIDDSGSGTAASPWVVDRALFTGMLSFGGCGSNFLSGKVVKLTNSRFYGNIGTSTPGGSAMVRVEPDGPRVIVEQSTLAPNYALPANGQPNAGGANFGFLSWVPFEIRNSDVWGSNIPVYFEIERNEAPSVIERNWLHGIWSCCSDHTDIVNGNFHASHITARGNYMDGVRTGGSVVTNAFGIYDDPSSSAGVFEDWTITGNRIVNYATGILCTESSSRFLNPWVVTNNSFGSASLQVYACRAPSAQSGNTVNGSPAVFN